MWLVASSTLKWCTAAATPATATTATPSSTRAKPICCHIKRQIDKSGSIEESLVWRIYDSKQQGCNLDIVRCASSYALFGFFCNGLPTSYRHHAYSLTWGRHLLHSILCRICVCRCLCIHLYIIHRQTHFRTQRPIITHCRTHTRAAGQH